MSVPTFEERKELIDGATLKELLQKLRYCPAGDPFFSDDDGSKTFNYLMARLTQMREDDPEAYVAASKAIDEDERAST